MCKKIGIALVAVLVGLFVVKKTEVGSWLKVCWKDTKNWVRTIPSVEAEIKKVKSEREDLVRDMDKYIHAVAEKSVEVDGLRNDVATLRTKQEKEERNIKAMRQDLASNNEFIVYNGNRYTHDQVEKELRSAFDSYKRADAGLKAKEQKLAALEEAYGKAREQLKAMQESLKDMDNEIALLEVEWEKVKLAEIRSKVQLDDSKFGKLKESMAHLQDRIAVERTALELRGEFSNGTLRTTEKEKPVKSVVQDVDDFFAKQNGAVVDKK
jgi:peptidoglycan hydrolase CwlO-like protein